MLVMPLKASPPLAQSMAGEESSAGLDDRALTVRHRDVTRKYGRWDCLFGCWEREGDTGEWREMIPNALFLDSNGHWLPDALLPSPPTDPRISSALTGYLSLIPSTYRCLAAPLKQHQWLALDLMWAVPELANFIDDLTSQHKLTSLMFQFQKINTCNPGREERLEFVERLMAGTG